MLVPARAATWAPITGAGAFALGQARPILQQAATGTATAAPATGPAAPFVYAAAGVMFALSFLFGRQRPRQKEQAAAFADEIERQLQANLAAYQDSPRTPEAQAAFLKNFDYAWAQFTAAMRDLGEPGERAVKERTRGGTVPGTDGNWFAWYRDPIANDPAASAALAPGATASTFPWGLVAGAALLLLGVIL
jgi:hypothetical protein